MNLLTGLMPPTQGSACAHGLSVTDDMQEFRRQLGVCPQHDVLWPSLTVTEHLRFFAGLKGVAPAAVADAVTDVIRRVGLTEKTHAQAGTLSGGQKRNLCLGIALIGGSRVLIIDEATSGMVRGGARWDPAHAGNCHSLRRAAPFRSPHPNHTAATPLHLRLLAPAPAPPWLQCSALAASATLLRVREGL